MRFLYTFSIYLYSFIVWLASPFNPKARKWIEGRKGILARMKKELASNSSKVIWFHCASLGEFEMGRPVMEMIRKEHPGIKLCVTFYSPSGYEIKKNYKGADYIFYLPTDTFSNAGKFLSILNPVAAVFIKYEFWFNYLRELEEAAIPTFLISAVFRKDHHFFKWYGAWSRQHLRMFKWIFVQTKESAEILENAGIRNYSVSGDTRFDRVLETVSAAGKLPLIERFAEGSKVFVAGSSWHPDEEMYLDYCVENSEEIKIIIAPHDVSENRIASIEKKINKPFVRYSKLNEKDDIKENILIIDSIGLLAGIYRYASLAFIGGGYGSGLHNILEAVAFGCPVFFGPKNEKFWEASALEQKGGAIVIYSREQFEKEFDKLTSDKIVYKKYSEACKKFIMENAGGSKMIADGISKVLDA